jgi:hypothetical protein
MPLAVCFGLVVVGLVIAAVGGFSHGSIAGGLISATGLVPACYAAWKGMQQETQASLGLAILGVLVSLGVGGLLILMAVIGWFR